MVKVCTHCGFHNTNFRYCGGCGRKLVDKVQKKFAKLPEGSTVFIKEVVNTIERVFRSQEVVTPSLEHSEPGISFSEIAKETGILYIDGEQWIKVEKQDKKKAFFFDVLLTYLLSVVLVVAASFVVPVNPILGVKIFYSCYIFINMLIWFIFPLATGSSVVAFLGKDLSIFRDEKMPVKGKVFTLLTFSVLMMLYSFIPLLLIEYLLMSGIKNYTPLVFKVAGVDYLRNTGG